ncbi:MAG: hypothetical protein ACXV7J_09030 [Methylomonas sp.]
MKLCRSLILLLAVGFLTACGNNSQPQQSAREAVRKYDHAVTLQGSVSDNKGLIKSGKVEARSPSGQLLAETALENSARFQLEIPAGTELPVILNFVPPEPATEKMVSVAVQPAISRYDINPSTTAIAKQAKALGGYTLRNMKQAAEDMVHVPDANKTSTGFRGDPTTQYGGWH